MQHDEQKSTSFLDAVLLLWLVHTIFYGYLHNFCTPFTPRVYTLLPIGYKGFASYINNRRLQISTIHNFLLTVIWKLFKKKKISLLPCTITVARREDFSTQKMAAAHNKNYSKGDCGNVVDLICLIQEKCCKSRSIFSWVNQDSFWPGILMMEQISSSQQAW